MLRVLVVDDNRDCATSLAMLVKMMGHEVFVAHDPYSAIKFATELRPHVVFLDIGLPGMNGYEVCRAIRNEPFEKSPFIYAHTAWSAEKDRMQSAEAGFDAHLTKPADYGQIRSLLTNAANKNAT